MENKTITYIKPFIYFLLLVNGLSLFGQNQIDSLSQTRKLTSFLTGGNIHLGSEYGVLPFLITNTPPQYNFVSDGYIGLQILELPFKASYRYSSLGSVSGINNHFTIDFDAQKFAQIQKNKLQAEKQKRLKKIDSLQFEIQKQKQKLDYLEQMKLKKQEVNISKPNLNSSKLDVFDIIDVDQLLKDSVSPSEIKKMLYDEIKRREKLGGSIDSTKNNANDSINSSIKLLTNSIKEAESLLETLKSGQDLKHIPLSKKDSILNKYKQQPPKKPSLTYKEKLTNLFSGVKKFGLGLTHPSYSEFLVARTPIRGVNIEYELDNIYVAFTHGKTVNNLFLTNNVLQNNLNIAQNAFNFFDFTNIQDGRRITALKGGYGKKNNTHLYIGALYGKGKVSYQDSSIFFDTERNLTLELDTKLKLKNHQFQLISGRSAIQVIEENIPKDQRLVNLITDFKLRSNAWLADYEFRSRSATINITTRLIDPFFRSLGVGFLRSDNLRYEIKAKQKLSKKVSISCFYRRESDNLLSIYAFKNIISSYGLGGTYKPTRRWLFKLDLRPLVIATNAANDQTIDSLGFTNDNYIINVIGNYNRRFKETYVTGTALYSFYQITLDNTIQTYQNTNISFNIQHKQHLVFDVIYNNYLSNDEQTLPVNNLVEVSTSYNLKKIQVQLTGKTNFGEGIATNYGYGLKGVYNLSPNFSLSLSGEKLVIGDFYNNIYQQNINQFPYFFSGGMYFHW